MLTWQTFGTAARELASAVHADGFEPDIVLAIARGGLFVAGALGYALDVKNLHVMNVEFYTGVDERLDLPVMLPPVPEPVDLAGARVLVADDVADTGATLALVKDFCTASTSPRCGARSIYEKPTLDRALRIRVARRPTSGSTSRGRSLPPVTGAASQHA